MRTDAQRAHHRAISARSYAGRKVRGVAVTPYHARKAAGRCVLCDTVRGEGDTGTQCRPCADYRNEQKRARES